MRDAYWEAEAVAWCPDHAIRKLAEHGIQHGENFMRIKRIGNTLRVTDSFPGVKPQTFVLGSWDRVLAFLGY